MRIILRVEYDPECGCTFYFFPGSNEPFVKEEFEADSPSRKIMDLIEPGLALLCDIQSATDSPDEK